MTVARAVRQKDYSDRPRIVREPAWEIARLFPEQGSWTEEGYLALDSKRPVEYSDCCVEVLPSPTDSHQAIVAFLYSTLLAFIEKGKLGRVRFAALPLRLWPGKFREPDILFLKSANDSKRTKRFWKGADLVMEVVSPSNRLHDLETKRFEYARAGISEYWIVDPQKSRILVYTLKGAQYVEHGTFARGSKAKSVLLSGFAVDVASVLDAE